MKIELLTHEIQKALRKVKLEYILRVLDKKGDEIAQDESQLLFLNLT